MTEIGPKKFGFSKAERLTGKKKIEELFKNGSSIFLHPFLVKFLKAENEDIHRVLISVPKKRFKRAVDRNLLKRRIREAYRLHKHLLDSQLPTKYHVGIIYQNDQILSFDEMEKNLVILLERLNKRIEKSDEKK